MLFQYGDLSVRRLVKEDGYVLSKWLSDPRVLEFYEGRDRPFTMSEIENEFISFREEKKTQALILYDGVEIGYIQFYEWDETMKNQYGYTDKVIYGMDQFIGEVTYWNKGIGSILVPSMVDYLLNSKGADRVVMDPQVRNKRALKCYEKCGFRKVKYLPSHELHEGEYQDCWLMDIRKSK